MKKYISSLVVLLKRFPVKVKKFKHYLLPYSVTVFKILYVNK